MKKGKDKKAKFQLGVADSKLGSVIQEETGFPCVCNEYVGELLRGIRQHSTTFLKDLSELDMRRAQLGLAHSYSRAKVIMPPRLELLGDDPTLLDLTLQVLLPPRGCLHSVFTDRMWGRVCKDPMSAEPRRRKAWRNRGPFLSEPCLKRLSRLGVLQAMATYPFCPHQMHTTAVLQASHSFFVMYPSSLPETRDHTMNEELWSCV